jgi:hypothetical protein
MHPEDRCERCALRQAADLGRWQRGYFELASAEQPRRLDHRQAEAPHTSPDPCPTRNSPSWAAKIDIPTPGELDGSEPIDDPPAGCATWDQWCRHRWPPPVSSRLLLSASAIRRCWAPRRGLNPQHRDAGRSAGSMLAAEQDCDVVLRDEIGHPTLGVMSMRAPCRGSTDAKFHRAAAAIRRSATRASRSSSLVRDRSTDDGWAVGRTQSGGWAAGSWSGQSSRRPRLAPRIAREAVRFRPRRVDGTIRSPSDRFPDPAIVSGESPFGSHGTSWDPGA